MRWDGGGSQTSLREANRRRVLRLLRTNGPCTRADLARMAQVSRSTISAIVNELIDEDLVAVRGEDSTRGQAGRPGSLVALNPSAGLAVGIDIEHRHLRVMVADVAHTVVGEAAAPLLLDHDASKAMQRAAELVHQVLEEGGLDKGRVLGVGLSLAGPVESIHGTVRPSSISPSWNGIHAAPEMERLIGLPVFVDNDANLGALAELMWGAARGVSEAVYLTVGSGIGAGLIIGGSVYRGSIGTAGEIGHSTVSDGGPVCRCGNRGCLERLAGGTAMLQELADSHGDGMTVDDLIRHLHEGEIACRRVVSDAGALIGAHLGMLCNLFNPSRVVIGGPLSAAGDVLLDPMRRSIERTALPIAAQSVDVVLGDLGDNATALGAVAHALRETNPGLFEARMEGGGAATVDGALKSDGQALRASSA